ncbi:PREDICTED: SH3 domain-containing RING finger protein 3-like isoform X2 [Papilio polytes]|uniref:SH3 domain-containing RING finger protein 3-like isoform X2 n=1 Tax=Papilio polytes TaxID=76194 RepID=UPI000676798B|nr:PREDICTED: SH3 domain-containing RING finger protein 3-like isoform X2 [Papilio polytes]
MDEGLLNDLLECSVCLERLDTSSRVLPCQHTFCLKCLKVIVESHKELRCPECRVLVEAKVEELPPNVLLMRILEGMKNSAPRKISVVQRAPRSGHSQSQTQQGARTEAKQLPPHARAIYDFISKEPGDLSFKKGDTIMLQKKLDHFWYQGECSGRTGMFPITYVQVVVALPVPTALCKALYDFRMSAPDEEGCLAFDKGAIITVHRRVDENWAEGRLERRVGIFPIAFVEFNQPARLLMNSVPLNRVVPPLPAEETRPGHSEHRHHRYQPVSLSAPPSAPPSAHGNYQNMAPAPAAPLTPLTATPHNYPPHAHSMLTQPQQILVPQTVSHGPLLTNMTRNIVEPTQTKLSLDFINHFVNVHNNKTVGIQNVSRINDYERMRIGKFDNYSQKPDTTYQNVRTHEHFPISVANFNANNVSSDSSSSMNTPSVGVSSTTTPNTSSNTSTCESAEPSLPSSPDNNTERNATVNQPNTTQNTTELTNVTGDNEADTSINTSMGVLSLNESSTATNTSLNVSLPPTESPKMTASTSQNQNESLENNDASRLDVPSSSKNTRPSGPDSLLNFGLGLQAALSPSHAKDGNYLSRSHREHHREREKRHSLTPSTHLQGNHTPINRHSAEILATSLLDHAPERDRKRTEREGERRRRRSRSNERPLPAAYVAMYPYKPQKSDELELKKGGVYTVTERCRDGWYKGYSESSQRCGVFPGNYVSAAHLAHLAHHAHAHAPHAPHAQHTPHTPHTPRPKHDKAAVQANPKSAQAPPDAPPRTASPTLVQPLTYPWSAQATQQTAAKTDKPKEKTKSEKISISTGVSLMKRLAAMKKCKSPPPVGYSMDNPVFEDGPGPSLAAPHPVHVRASNEGPWQSQHRKSQSLDVTVARRDRHHAQPVKERFRCIAPYPPNSEYELELKVDDIVVVSRKRGDGWYKGTLQRTGRTGLFPASFVQSCPQD